MLLHFVELHILVLEAKPALEVEENEGKEKKTVKKKDKTNESKEKWRQRNTLVSVPELCLHCLAWYELKAISCHTAQCLIYK